MRDGSARPSRRCGHGAAAPLAARHRASATPVPGGSAPSRSQGCTWILMVAAWSSSCPGSKAVCVWGAGSSLPAAQSPFQKSRQRGRRSGSRAWSRALATFSLPVLLARLVPKCLQGGSCCLGCCSRCLRGEEAAGQEHPGLSCWGGREENKGLELPGRRLALVFSELCSGLNCVVGVRGLHPVWLIPSWAGGVRVAALGRQRGKASAAVPAGAWRDSSSISRAGKKEHSGAEGVEWVERRGKAGAGRRGAGAEQGTRESSAEKKLGPLAKSTRRGSPARRWRRCGGR
ncbi:uncharacterized protein LOC104062094 [Cuculus canorus]|uniref:uncharacterized protein LOC104062094 n=1 Tax=Cuculus canorus TaxID=55661 RepID=UPI0023AABE71|nr:uncharacterized protein LOC104062094 [Cuculus canorus]